MNKLWGLLAAIAAVLVFAGSALALGTVKGTVIKNSATVSYKSVAAGSPTYNASSNEVTTTVQQVLGVAIKNPGGNAVVPGQTNVANYYTLTNNGNFEDQFAIAPLTPTASVTAGAAHVHVATNVRYYVNSYATASAAAFDGIGTGAILLPTDASGNAITPFIASNPASGAAGASSGWVQPGDLAKIYPNDTTIFVVVDIPNTAVNGDVTNKTQPAGSVKSVGDVTKSNGTSVSMDDTVQAGSLGVRKDVRNVTAAEAFTAVGPGSGPSATTGKPGDTLEYRITVTNNGAGTATNIQVTDNLVPETTYGAITGFSGTGTASQVSPGPGLVVNVGTGATAGNGGSLDPGQSATFTFTVTIN